MMVDHGNSRNRTIYVLTRTAARPKFFERCAISVAQQTYHHVVHAIGVEADDEATMQYVAGSRILRSPEIIKYTPADAAFANSNIRFYNRYLDYMQRYICSLNPEGWVTFLDDDDVLASKSSLQMLMQPVIKHPGKYDLVIGQCDMPVTGRIPQQLGVRPKIDDICGSGWMFRAKYWKPWKVDRDANYIAAQDVYDAVGPDRVAYVDKVVMTSQRVYAGGGYGARDDLDDVGGYDHTGLEG